MPKRKYLIGPDGVRVVAIGEPEAEAILKSMRTLYGEAVRLASEYPADSQDRKNYEELVVAYAQSVMAWTPYE